MSKTLHTFGAGVAVYLIVAACGSRPQFVDDAGLGKDATAMADAIGDAITDPIGEAHADPMNWTITQMPCNKTAGMVTYAELAVPGKTVADLAPATSVLHFTNQGSLPGYQFVNGQVFVKDGFVAVACGTLVDYVVFAVPK